MKIYVDYGKCAGLGVCESLAPDVFEVQDSGEMVLRTDIVTGDQVDAVRLAVDGCPTAALRLEP